jgi:predicted enzyme related to lactoylglutathione lyase
MFAPRIVMRRFAPLREERSPFVPNPVVHFEIIGTDAPKLQKFYGDLFAWNVNADNEFQYGMVEPGGERGINGGIGGDMGGGKRVTVYIEVDDPQAYLDRAVQLGGSILMAPTEIMPGTTIAMFADPEGNVTGLTKAEGS